MNDKVQVKKKQYEGQRMISAIAAVRNEESFKGAASRFDIPVTTLRDRYHGK